MEFGSGFASERPIEYLTTKEGYDRWAAIYDAEENPLILLEEKHLPPLLGDVRDLAVADLGCGTGRQAVRLAAAGARVTALDFSDGMVARARGKPGWERIESIAHDLNERLPLPDGFFSECRRVCRHDGFVLISVFHPALTVHGIHARFVDPITGADIRPASHGNQLSDYVMGAARSGLTLEYMSEHAVDDDLAAGVPRAAKYRGWPLLLLMKMRP